MVAGGVESKGRVQCRDSLIGMYPGNLDPTKGGDSDRKEQLQFVGSRQSFW